RVAIVVFANMDATAAPGQIAGRIATAIFSAVDRESEQATDQAKRIFSDLQHGRIDRALLTSNASAYFSDQALADFASSLGPLGTPETFAANPQFFRGGMGGRTLHMRAGGKNLSLTTFTLTDGKLEQYQIAG